MNDPRKIGFLLFRIYNAKQQSEFDKFSRNFFIRTKSMPTNRAYISSANFAWDSFRPTTETGEAIWALIDLAMSLYFNDEPTPPEYYNIKAQIRSMAGLE